MKYFINLEILLCLFLHKSVLSSDLNRLNDLVNEYANTSLQYADHMKNTLEIQIAETRLATGVRWLSYGSGITFAYFGQQYIMSGLSSILAGYFPLYDAYFECPPVDLDQINFFEPNRCNIFVKAMPSLPAIYLARDVILPKALEYFLAGFNQVGLEGVRRYIGWKKSNQGQDFIETITTLNAQGEVLYERNLDLNGLSTVQRQKLFSAASLAGNPALMHSVLDDTNEKEKELHKYIPSEEDRCGICWEDYGSSTGNGALLKNECGHVFHALCLKNWITIRSICPICKSNVKEATNLSGIWK